MNLLEATIAQILIPVDDLDRSITFYRDTLGLRFLFSAPPQMTFYQCGTVRLLVAVHSDGQTAQRGSTVYFQVEDIQAVYQTLREKGVIFSAEPHVVHKTPEFDLWLAEFRDPDGNQLALMSSHYH
jgi:methylmalonyl-CoA/ethylmalonyl-CoA epimerase